MKGEEFTTIIVSIPDRIWNDKELYKMYLRFITITFGTPIKNCKHLGANSKMEVEFIKPVKLQTK